MGWADYAVGGVVFDWGVGCAGGCGEEVCGGEVGRGAGEAGGG